MPWMVVVPNRIDARGNIVDYVPVLKDGKPALLDELLSESMLLSSPLPVTAEPALIPNFIGFLGLDGLDGFRGAGVFFNVEGLLITSGHSFFEKNKLLSTNASRVFVYRKFSQGRPIGREVDFTAMPCHRIPVPKTGGEPFQWIGSGLDLVAYEPPAGFFASLGVKQLSWKDLSTTAEGQVTVYGNPSGVPLVSSGAICMDENLMDTRGLLSHTASTREGFSGSPGVVRGNNGKLSVVFTHVCGDIRSENLNHGAQIWGIYELLRIAGKLPTPQLETLFSHTESRETKRQRRANLLFDEYVGGLVSTVEQERDKAANDEAKDRLCGGDEPQGYHPAFTTQKRSDKTYAGIANFKSTSKHGNWSDMADSATAEPAELKHHLSPHVEKLLLKIQQLEDKQKLLEDQLSVTLLSIVPIFEDKMTAASLDPSAPVLSESPDVHTPATCDPAQAMKARMPTMPTYATWSQSRNVDGLPGRSAGRSMPPNSYDWSKKLHSPPGLPPPLPSRYSKTFEHFSKRASFGDKAYKNFLKEEEILAVPQAWSEMTDGNIGKQLTDAEARALLDGVVKNPVGLLAFQGVDPETLLTLPCFSSMRQYIDAAGIQVKNITRASPMSAEKPGVGVVMKNDIGETVFARTAVATKRGHDKNQPEMLNIPEEVVAVMKKIGIDFTSTGKNEGVSSKYVFPPTGTKGSLESLISQSEGMRLTPNMDAVPTTCSTGTREETERFRTILKECYEEYPASTPPLFQWQSGDDSTGTWSKLFNDIFMSFDGSKSAGWSAILKPGQKSAWLNDVDGQALLIKLSLQRLALRMCCIEKLGSMRPLEMVLLGLKDPSVVFTKSEPHTEKKADKKAWRQIWASSLLDSVVQCITHKAQNVEDIAAYASGMLNSQAIGIGHHDAGIERFGEILDRLSYYGDIYDRDASGWDLTVVRDAIMLDAERRTFRGQTSYECMGVFSSLLQAQGLISSAHIACIGKDLWECAKFGVTDSGSVSTSAQNSPIRQIQVRLCGATAAVSVGDDLLYTGLIDDAMLSSFGVVTKPGGGCHGPSGPHEFTSHSWTKEDGKWNAKFLNFHKLLAGACFKAKTVEGSWSLGTDALGGMLFALRHCQAERQLFSRFLHDMGIADCEALVLVPNGDWC